MSSFPQSIDMKYYLYLFLIVCCYSDICAQYPDNNWVLGKGGGFAEQDSFGLVILNFSGNHLTFSDELEVDYRFQENNSVISYNDTLLAYFNGWAIHNRHHEVIENGDSMHIGDNNGSYHLPQGSLLLPSLANEQEFFLFTADLHHNEAINETTGKTLRYSIINITTVGEGAVSLKNEVLLTHPSLETTKLTATRHANGRDWWIIWKYYDDNVYIRYLLSPNGLARHEDQTIGAPFPSGLGQAVFSPDGSTYAIFNTISAIEGVFVSIYDFDRCSGLLSNQRLIAYPHDGGVGGAAISPNSRYLYIPSVIKIYQYDLWAEDIEASRVTIAENDGSNLNKRYYLAQLARDGKIYIAGGGFSNALNVIEYPDRAGLAATVTTLELPVHSSFGVPNFPNHRLGPIDDRSCDTLGINNIPLASFRPDQDTSNYLSFYFQDLSSYEPTAWTWTFGDGGISQDTSPVHVYQQDGTYEVCLTVANDNGTHTHCQILEVGVVNVDTPDFQVNLQVFPNPFQHQFSITLHDYYPRNATVKFYGISGHLIKDQRIYHGWNTIEGNAWPAGIYFYELWDNGVKLGQGKIVKAN